MKKVIDFTRALIISIEFVLLLIWVVLIFSKPQFPEWIISHAVFTDEKIKWLALLPAGLMALVFKDFSGVIFPEKDKLNIITEFPDFWKLKNIMNSALFYSIIFTIMGVIAWFLDPKKETATLIITLAISIIGAGITYISVHNATVVINTIFSSNGKIS